ncbi:MAG: DUF892 family protein [Acidobacteriota bacterium]|nr:DUF892 family protein [Acidobacteriota bacterium]
MADKITVKDLLEDEIKDLYSAEKQLIKAIPKMAKGANDPKLQTAFKDHLVETQGQVRRLEEVAKLLEFKPSGKNGIGRRDRGRRRGDLPRFFQPVITEDFRIAANSLGVR